MEGIDQKAVVSSRVPGKHGKTVVDVVATASQPASDSIKKSVDDSLNSPKLDPTRFGDWESAGRCIDF